MLRLVLMPETDGAIPSRTEVWVSLVMQPVLGFIAANVSNVDLPS
jgi:hypothetical protein